MTTTLRGTPISVIVGIQPEAGRAGPGEGVRGCGCDPFRGRVMPGCAIHDNTSAAADPRTPAPRLGRVLTGPESVAEHCRNAQQILAGAQADFVSGRVHLTADEYRDIQRRLTAAILQAEGRA